MRSIARTAEHEDHSCSESGRYPMACKGLRLLHQDGKLGAFAIAAVEHLVFWVSRSLTTRFCLTVGCRLPSRSWERSPYRNGVPSFARCRGLQ